MFVVEIFSREGVRLAEFERARNISVAYAFNGGKTATFDMPMDDPKLTETTLAFGNLVIIWSDQLEPWSGYLVRPSYVEDTVSILCHPISGRLAQRKLRPHKLENVPAGYLFTHLINQANARRPTGIVLGDVYQGGKHYTLEVGTESVLDKLNELFDLTKYEWDLTMVNPGLWTVSFAEKIGRDLTGDFCIEYGKDTHDAPQYEEDWTNFANAITVAGKVPDGQTGGDQDPAQEWQARPVEEFVNWASVDAYGLAEDILEAQDVSDRAMLREQAFTEAMKRSVPTVTASLTLNNARGLWSRFGDGDIVCLYMPFYRFKGLVVPVRVLGREVNENGGEESMTAVVEVVQGRNAEGLTMYKSGNYPAPPSYPGAE